MKRKLPVLLMACLLLSLIAYLMIKHENIVTGSLPSEMPLLSHAGGFYKEPFELSIKAVDMNVEIRYTLDGSDPDASSPLYIKPLKIEKPYYGQDTMVTVIKARLFKDGEAEGKLVTRTFFVQKDIDKRFNMPVVSIAVNPADLFDYEKGIYVQGKVFDDWRAKNPAGEINGGTPANYNQRGKEWERPVHIELYESSGSLGFSQYAGVRTFGGWSRANPQISLRVFAKSEYDDKDNFDYEIFPGLKRHTGDNKALDSYKRFILRDSGNDFYSTMFRDGMMQKLAEKAGIDVQAYRPAVVYINGEYWGIQNLRESYDEFYIENNYAVDKNKVVILTGGENDLTVDYGEPDDLLPYRKILDFVRGNDLSLPSNYKKVNEMMDVENYMVYCMFQLYFGNNDWPWNNERVWRVKADRYEPDAPYGLDGRWRWMMMDTDFGFALYNNYWDDNFTSNVAPGGYEVLLPGLLRNTEFRNNFINCFSDYLNTSLATENVLDVINGMQLNIAPEIGKHIIRWHTSGDSLHEWDKNVAKLRSFAMLRPGRIKELVSNYFKLEGSSEINIKIGAPGGNIKVNSIEIRPEKKVWSGEYFKGIPVKVSAVPDKGYRFAGWTVDGAKIEIDHLTLSGNAEVTARFEKLSDVSEKTIYINEIMSCGTKNGGTDWIELYNPGKKTLNLKGYYLSDSKENLKKWQMSGVAIKPGEFIRIWCSGRDLRNPRKELHTNFKIKTGETVYLTLYDGKSKVDEFPVVKTSGSESYGHYPDGYGSKIYLKKPTPAAANDPGSEQPAIQPSITNRIMIDGELLGSRVKPLMVDGVVYGPVESLARKLDIGINKVNSRNIEVFNGNIKMVMTVGSDTIYINGEKAIADRAVMQVDGHIYVPMRFLVEKLNWDFYWYERGSSVIVSRKG